MLCHFLRLAFVLLNTRGAWLAQLDGHVTLDHQIVNSSPALGIEITYIHTYVFILLNITPLSSVQVTLCLNHLVLFSAK